MQRHDERKEHVGVLDLMRVISNVDGCTSRHALQMRCKMGGLE